MNIRIILITLILGLLAFIAYLFLTDTREIQQPNDEPVPTEEVPLPDTFPDATQVPMPAALFNTLLLESPTPLTQKVLDNVYLDTYFTYPCTLGETNSTVLMLTAQYKENRSGMNTVEEAEAAIKAWEPDMFQAIGHLVFPADVNVRNGTTISFETVPGTDFRRALISISGEEYYLYYGWLLNYILFADSEQCLEETMESVYSPGSH